MTTLTGLCRLAKKGEEGMVHAPWWEKRPHPLLEVKRKKNFNRTYKRNKELSRLRQELLRQMIIVGDGKKSNCDESDVRKLRLKIKKATIATHS